MFEGTTESGAHIFISYSRANLELVQQLSRDLMARGINIWIDKIGLKPGTPDWENALREAIQQSDGVILVASPNSRQSSYVRDELAIARAANKPFYPVWAEGTEYSDAIPMGMGYIQFVDLRGDSYETGINALVEALTAEDAGIVKPAEKELSTVDIPAGFEPRNPYKGLRAFREEDRGDFFGRDLLIQELLQSLNFDTNDARFLAVVGASGSGKSSVVMAGLLPELKDGALPDSENWLYLEPIVPSVHPLENLTIALSDAFPEKSQTAIREDLDNPNTRGLANLARQAAKQSRLVLYIDQFEELFTLTSEEDERRQFIDLLTTAVTEPDGSLVVVLSLRADFYDRPLEYNAMGDLVKAQTIPVLPMTLADLYDVIEQPAELEDVQLSFEDGLVTDILFAVRDEVGALPLLQFTLDQLFQQRDGLTLTKAAYEAMGGVRGALTQHAEQVFAGLPSDNHRHMARTLFLRLIEPGATEQDTTRRRADQSELTLANPQDTAILQATANEFIDNRLLVRDEETIEVAHEALIREWERLQVWLDDSRADLRFQRVLSSEVNEWLKSGQDTSFLLSGSRLIQYEEWQETTDLDLAQNERAYIQASIAERARQDAEEAERRQREQEIAERADTYAARTKQLRRSAIVLGVVIFLAILASIALGVQVVNTQDEVAEGQTQIAGVEPTLDIANTQIAAVEPTLAAANAEIELANTQISDANVQSTQAQFQVAQAENQIASATVQISTAQAQIIVANEQVAFGETQVAGLEPTVQAANTQVAGVQPTLDSANAEIEFANTQIAGVAPTLDAADSQIIQANTQVAFGETQVAGVEPTLNAADQQINAANTQVAFGETQVAQFDPTIEFAGTQVAGVGPTLDAADAQVVQANTEVAGAGTQIALANTQVAFGETQVAGVEPTLNAADSQIFQANTQVAFGETQVAQFEPTIAAANTQVAGVEPTLSAADQQINAANTQVAFGETQVAGVEPTLSAADQQINAANTQVAFGETQVAQFEPTIESANTQVAGVEPTLDAADQQINAANTQVAGVQPTLDAADSQIIIANTQVADANDRVAEVEPTVVAANTSIAAVEPTLNAANEQIEIANTQVAFGETQVAGVEPTLAAADVQIIAANTQVAFGQTEVAALQPTVEAAEFELNAANTQVAGVEPTLDAANVQIEVADTQVAFAETQVAGVAPTLNAANTQIAGVVPTLESVQQEVEAQSGIATALRLVRSAQQLLEAGNPDLAIALVLQAYELNPALGEVQRILNDATPLTVRLTIDSNNASNVRRSNLAQFTPDERWLLVGTNDGVEVWDLSTRGLMHSLPVSRVTAMAISPNGEQVVVGAENGRLHVFDVATGLERWQLTGHTSRINDLDYHPTEQQAISGDQDGFVYVWNLERGERINQLPEPHNFPVEKVTYNEIGSSAYSYDFNDPSVTPPRNPRIGVFNFGQAGAFRSPPEYRGFSPDGRIAYVGGDSTGQFLTFFDADSTVEQRRFQLGNASTDYIENIDFSDDGRFILVEVESRNYDRESYVVTDRYLAIWNITTGGEERRFAVPIEDPDAWDVYSVDLSADGSLAVIGGRYNMMNTVSLWDVNTGRELRRFTGHEAPPIQVNFSSDSRYAVSVGSDGDVRVWDIGTVELNLVGRVEVAANSMEAFGVSGDGTQAYIAFNNRSLTGYDLMTGEEIRTFRQSPGELRDIEFNPVFPQALVVGLDRMVLWDLTTLQWIDRFDDVNPGDVDAIAFSPDGNYLFYSIGRRTYRWHIPTRSVLQEINVGADHIASNGNNEFVALAQNDEITIVDMVTNTIVQTLIHDGGPINSLDYSPHDDTVMTAISEPDNSVIVWDIEAGIPRYTLIGHTAAVTDALYSPDGLAVLSGSDDTSLILWDLSSGQAIRQYQGHTAPIRQIAFNPVNSTAHSISTVLEDGIISWRVESAADTVNWIYANRYIRQINCQERLQYGVTPLCEDGVIPTAQPTPTAQATATPTPTSTPRPSPTPTFTPIPTGLIVTNGAAVNIRSGAGAGFSAIGQVENGTRVEILETLDDIGWARVRLPDGTEGWIISSAISR